MKAGTDGKRTYREIIVIAIPATILNLIFLESSDILESIPGYLNHGTIGYVLFFGTKDLVVQGFGDSLIANYFADKYGNLLVGGFYLDAISLSCTLVIFGTLLRRNVAKRGKMRGLLKAVQITDLCLLPLGAEIWLGVYVFPNWSASMYLSMFVTETQQQLGGVWAEFSNLDYFYCTLGILVISTAFLEVPRMLRRQLETAR